MSREDELNQQVERLIGQLTREFADLGDEARWRITRALLHRAVHFATAQPGVDYCALATYLAEMIGHAHQLAHGKDERAHKTPGHLVH